MSSDIRGLINQLDKKKLYELAKQRRINIPKKWSKALIIELLTLNVSKKDIQNMVTQPLETRITPTKDLTIAIKASARAS